MKKMPRYIGRWLIIVVSFFVMVGLANDIYIKQTEFITFYELVLMQMNLTHSLLFAMPFLLLLFSAIGDKPIDQISAKTGLSCLKQAIISALTMVLLLLAAGLIFSLVSRGFKAFSNEWSYNSGFSMTGMSPIVSTIIAVLLFGMRCVFLFYLVYLINILTKKPYWGFWVVLLISFIDFRFYKQTHISYPLNILPVEHTRILYTSAFNDPIGTVTRGSYFISILYWIVLILIIYEIINVICARRRQTT